MNSAHSSRRLMGIIAGIVAIGLLVPAIAADKSKRPMRETATVPSDSNVLKRFGAVEDYLAEKRWIEAIDVLQEISQTDGRMLVLDRPGESGGVAGYVNVTTRCNVLLSRLPPDGLAAYRKKADPQAKRWFENWKQTRDAAELQRIVRHAYLSSLGDDALWGLGEIAWDHADYALARLYWTQLLPLGKGDDAAKLPTMLRYPDSDIDIAEVQSRLILCTLMEGEPDRAAGEQARFAELFPFAEGTLAGRRSKLSDILKQILDDASKWELPSGVKEVSTFGVTPNRSGTLSSTVEIGAARWSRKLPANSLPHHERLGGMPDAGPLSYHPVVFQDIVFVNDAERIWAWNVLSGEPAWPNEKGTAEIYIPDAQVPTTLPVHKCSGVPFYTMTIAEGRLYARMGSAITNRANDEDAYPSDLVCLDVASAQGRLVWKIASSELSKDNNRPWRFEGSPIVAFGRVYVALSRRRQQLEFSIACLDAATGTLLWNRSIGTGRTAADENQNRVSHLLLTAGGGKLFFCQDAGAIVAVNAGDGRPEWAVTYESNILQEKDLSIFSVQLRQGLVPAMFHEGWLFVAPNDSDWVFCIEADSGQVYRRWDQPDGDRCRHLLGIVPGGRAGRLILSGNSLWSLDIDSIKNKIVFGPKSNMFGGLHPADMRGYGRGILAGHVIFWPTRDAIKIVDAASGKTISNKPLNTPQSAEVGGNIILTQEMLLVAQPDRLVAYCEYSLLKQRLERELSDRGDHAPAVEATVSGSSSLTSRAGRMTTEDILGQLSEIEAATGQLDAAANALRKGILSAEQRGDQTIQARFRNRLMELLRQSAREALENGKATEAWDNLIEARTLTADPVETAKLLIDMGKVEASRDCPASAIELWQQILDEPRLRDVPDRLTTAGAMATAAISKLISEQGRGSYRSVEHRASEAISTFAMAGDTDGLRDAIRQFPNSLAASEGWRTLARLERQKGHLHRALEIYSQLAHASAGEVNDRATVVAEWADSLEASGYRRPAMRAWAKLASDELINETIQFKGSSIRVGTLAQDRLRRLEGGSTESIESSQATFFDRVWSVPLTTHPSQNASSATLATTSQVIIPEGDPPTDQLASLLINRGNSQADLGAIDWACVDHQAGHIRWKRTMESSPRWAAYWDTHLLLATETHLSALTLEEGHELWSVPLIPQTDVEYRRGSTDANAARSSPSITSSKLSPQIQLAIRDRWVFKFSPMDGLAAIDAQTGQTAWSFTPPRGKLQRAWKCGSRKIAMQTLRPSIIWLVEVSGELKVSERPGGTEPWLQGPNLDDDKAIFQVTQDHRIERRSIKTGRSSWTYRGGMSIANANPVLWSNSGQLLLTVDGTTLAGVNRDKGVPDWSVGLADLPLDHPESQTIVVGDAVFAASHGLLRRISLKYRECQWERYLGVSTDQWRVAACASMIAAWPTEPRSRPASMSVATVPQFVVWCDAKSGRILQRYNIAPGERLINVTGGLRDCIVETDRAVFAFRAKSESDE